VQTNSIVFLLASKLSGFTGLPSVFGQRIFYFSFHRRHHCLPRSDRSQEISGSSFCYTLFFLIITSNSLKNNVDSKKGFKYPDES
jgi:hypothetical protein